MNTKNPDKKRFFRKRWLLPPAVVLVLFFALVIFHHPPSFNDQDFRTEFMKQAPALNFKIVAESTAYLSMEDLPLLTRLRLTHFPPELSHLESIADGDGTDTFLVEDNETKMRYEIDIYSKDHLVRAVALHYPAKYLEQARPLQRRLEKQFRGLPLVLRKGYLFTPTPQLDKLTTER